MEGERPEHSSSRFTRGAKTLATGSWGVTLVIPAWTVKKLIEELQERSAKKAAQSTVRRTASGCSGCLSVALFGMTLYVAALVMVITGILFVDAAVAAFALLVTLAWGIGVGVDRIRERRANRVRDLS